MYFSNPHEAVVSKETSEYNPNLDEHDEPDNHKDNPDPFLFTDSKVMTGNGRAVVCAVGANTMAARARKKNDLVLPEEKTHLEGLLAIFGEGVTQFAKMACFGVVIAQLVFLLFMVAFNDELKLFSNDFLMRCAKIGVVAVVMLIVSVPEGLPVAVSIAMAMSTESLKKDKILIKKLESVQTCAMVHDICVGKTGTLTTSDISVISYQLGDT